MPYQKSKPILPVKVGSIVRVKHYIQIPKIDKDKENNLTAKVESVMDAGNVVMDRDLRGSRIWHKDELIVIQESEQ